MSICPKILYQIGFECQVATSFDGVCSSEYYIRLVLNVKLQLNGIKAAFAADYIRLVLNVKLQRLGFICVQRKEEGTHVYLI